MRLATVILLSLYSCVAAEEPLAGSGKLEEVGQKPGTEEKKGDGKVPSGDGRFPDGGGGTRLFQNDLAQPLPSAAAEPVAKAATEPLQKAGTLRYAAKKADVKTELGDERISGSGGSRSALIVTTRKGERQPLSVKFPDLQVLTPPGVGLTTRAQPSLFYFQSGEVPRGYFKFTLEDRTHGKILLRTYIPVDGKKQTPAILRVSLARLKVSLEPKTRYRWVAAFGLSKESSSLDVVSSGSIQYVEPSEALKKELGAAAPADRAAVYAAHGIWYEALEELSNLVAKAPDNRKIRALRADLLKQVGLDAAAAADR